MYLPEGVFVNKTNIVGGLNMAIKNIEMDRRESIRWYYRERQAESAHLRGLA